MIELKEITSEGVKADSVKTKTFIHMLSPTNISGVKRFCVVVQYMTKFLPSLQLSNLTLYFTLLHAKTHPGPD